MLSHKQGKYLSVLLAVGAIYIPYVLASLAISVVPGIALERAYSAPAPNIWGLATVWLVAIYDLLLLIWISVLAVRTVIGKVPVSRFLAVTAFSLLTFLVVGYLVMVLANLTFGMGWSIL